MPLPEFQDVLFPLRIAFGASGGPERLNEIVPLAHGGEQRNARRRHARRRWDVGTGIRSIDDLREVMGFFEARRGSLIAFRFPDPFDNASSERGEPEATDQLIGVGDGAERRFSLIKRYGQGADAYERPIALPRGNTVRVAVDGVETDVTVDGGAIMLAEAPAAGASITAGFRFDVPARFDIAHLSASITAFKAGELPTVPLVEVRQ